MKRAFIGVGSNIDPETNIQKALVLLKNEVNLIVTSTFYKSKPLLNKDQPSYYNGVWEIKTNLPPMDLKYNVLRKIENQLGRERTDDKYASRPIDLDLIYYEGFVINNDQIQIPDPDIYTRNFIAVPFYELANDLIENNIIKKEKIVENFDISDLIILKDFSEKLKGLI